MSVLYQLPNTFFSDTECKAMIDSTANKNWEKIEDGFRYSQTLLDDSFPIRRIVNTFKEVKQLDVGSNIILRCLRLERGDKLPTHTFNYSIFPDSRYKNTVFGIHILLGGKYVGGEYYFNNKNLPLTIGQGVIHNTSTKGKITEVKSGTCYILIGHILKIETNKFM